MRPALLGPVVFLLSLWAIAPPVPEARAQQPPPPPLPPAEQAEPSPEQDRATSRFRLADSYIRSGQPDRAAAILEDLLAEDPDNVALIDRLKMAYVGARAFDEALGLIESIMARTGPTTALLSEMATVHMAAGDRDAAERAWREALAVAPERSQTYRTVYATMVQSRLWEEARDVLLEARRRLGQPDAFRIELGELYARSNQYAEALEEWAELLAEDVSRYSYVQARLARLLDQDGATPAFRSALDRLIRREPMRLPYRRLAAWLAAEVGDFDAGLDHTRAVDRLGQERGESLFAFAESALQAGALDVAERAFDLVSEAHPASASAAMSLLSSALLAEKRGRDAGERRRTGAGPPPTTHYDAARQRYRRFLDTYPNHAQSATGLHRLALIERDVYGNFDAATEHLSTIIARARDTEVVGEARFALGEVALMQGDLTRARLAFTQIESQLRTGGLAERARLEIALLDYYEGNFEMALARVDAMRRNTATDVANNAIDLRLLLSESQGPDSLSTPLRRFAEAELLQRQLRPDEALAALDALLPSLADHALADEAQYRRASILRDLERSTEAIDILDAYPGRFPESYLTDRALFLAAEIRERDVRDLPGALEAYVRFLRQYPGSILAPEARVRIRRLRGDRPS
jgi:cellulose synthase operon protein C